MLLSSVRAVVLGLGTATDADATQEVAIEV
jgi:hypothetical protein